MKRTDIQRYCRNLHGWLSAVAFLALCFFAFTGLLLNHPEWFAEASPAAERRAATLTAAEIEELDWASEPGRLLAEYVGGRMDLNGRYTGGGKASHEVFARLQGVRGLTDLRANLETAEVEVILESSPPLLLLNELHRGERASDAWRLFIDVAAVLLVVLSLTGYLLFLLLRFRRRTALVLTGLSTLMIYGLYSFTVF